MLWWLLILDKAQSCFVRHWATPTRSPTSQSCGRPEPHGGSTMGTDSKTAEPELQSCFSQPDPVCGGWVLHSPPLCDPTLLPGSRWSLPAQWHLPCTNHSTQSPAAQFQPSSVGFPYLWNSSPHSAQACACTDHLALKWCGWTGTVMLDVEVVSTWFLFTE